MSCADVCIDMDYDEGNEFFRVVVRRARKQHACCECKRAILVGERYEYACGKSDGRVWSAKTCAECADIRRALVCGSWEYGKLFEAIEEQVFPEWDRLSPIDCLAQVESLEARNVLRKRYTEWRQ